jgi:hypothetical protein
MSETNVIEAHFVATELNLADFNNAAWQKAPAAHLTRYWSGDAAPTSRHAEARLLWSNEALHLRFTCHQAEPLVISERPQTEKKTMGLWDRDVCEIFIAPDPNTVERYFEFEAAPTGEWLDVAIHWSAEKRESDWTFNSHMTTAARIERDRLTIAMRIPWNQWIHEPQKGERWRINLLRCIGRDPNRGYLAWQPTGTPEPSFHLPRVFGWLIFK